MASSKAQTKKLSTKKLPKLERDRYSQLKLTDLIVFALSYLKEKEADAATEEIISICFRLFPHRFGLKNYPHWPDSALVIRRLNDAREKKLVKGNPNDGFALTFKGKQIAKRAAKALGMASEEKAMPASKQKPVEVVLKKKTLRQETRSKPTRTKPIKEKFTKPKPTKKKVVTRKPIEKAPNNRRIVTTEKLKQIKTAKKKASVKKPQPKSLTLALPQVQTKKKFEVKKTQVEVKKEAVVAKPKPVEVAKTIPALVVSKEEKIKAAKVIKMVEKSDAYRLYVKNGKQAKISEFDFRNMLFATMESSSDTLTRNVGLFKRYAGIYKRNDLIKFFDYCEEHFAWILKKKR